MEESNLREYEHNRRLNSSQSFLRPLHDPIKYYNQEAEIIPRNIYSSESNFNRQNRQVQQHSA